MSTTSTAPLADPRMWRRLLARAHPDAGGDHELFLFTHALLQSVGGNLDPKSKPTSDDERGTERGAEPSLRAWHDAMGCWASRNRETLKRFMLSEIPFAPAED